MPAAGDVLIRGREGASVWLAERGGLAVRVHAGGVELPPASCGSVELRGRDVASRIADVGLTPGVGASNVTGSNVAPASLPAGKIGGVLAPGKGGTGTDRFPAGSVLAVPDAGGLRGSPALSVTEAGGLRALGGLRVGAAGEISGGSVRSAGSARGLGTLHKGAPPAVTASLSVDGTVEWQATDGDGDLRAVLVRYDAADGLAAAEVEGTPHDRHHVNDGATEQVYVGVVSGAYRFYADKDGLYEVPAALTAGASYRFETVVGGLPDDPFRAEAEAEVARYSAAGGALSGPDDFLQFTAPAGPVAYSCEEHPGMAGAFAARAALPPARNPVASLAGAFDPAGVPRPTKAHVVAVDSFGNVSDAAVVGLL